MPHESSIHDSSWSKFEFECNNPSTVSGGLIQTLISQCSFLHTQMPLIRVRLNNDVFRIEFENGKLWRVKFGPFDPNPDVFYMLDNTVAWKREFIIQNITPIMNTMAAIRHTYQLTKMDGIPV